VAALRCGVSGMRVVCAWNKTNTCRGARGLACGGPEPWVSRGGRSVAFGRCRGSQGCGVSYRLESPGQKWERLLGEGGVGGVERRQSRVESGDVGDRCPEGSDLGCWVWRHAVGRQQSVGVAVGREVLGEGHGSDNERNEESGLDVRDVGRGSHTELDGQSSHDLIQLESPESSRGDDVLDRIVQRTNQSQREAVDQ
jgi:hypothetical protein